MFGDKPVVRPTIATVWVNENKASCNGVTIDLTADGDPDPGFVPDGAVCQRNSKERKVILCDVQNISEYVSPEVSII